MSMLIFFGGTQDIVKSGVSLTPEDTIRYHTSPLIAEQAPDFIRVDHPKFVTFLEAYFEYLETKGNPGERGFFLRDLSDIDDTLDEFIQHFKYQYLNPFPNKLAIDKATNTPVDEKRLLKRIKEFYRAKGTEKSYKLLMRILNDTFLSFYYPKEDILKTSHGKWYEQPIIKTTSTIDVGITGPSGETGESNIFQTVGNLVYQVKNNSIIANAKVEKAAIRYSTKNDTYSELTLSNVSGFFEPGFLITSGGSPSTDTKNVDAVTQKEYIYPLITDVRAITAGRFYDVGDIINITSRDGRSRGAKAIVTSTGTRGEINEIRMIDNGLDYRPSATVGPYAVLGTDTNYGSTQGYYYPLYTSSFAAGESHIHKFTEFPGQEFYMPNGFNNHGKSDAGGYDLFVDASTQGVSFDISTFKGTGASFEAKVGSLALYPGVYLNDDGKLSSGKKIRDNYYYQEFSYELKSNITLDKYKQSFLDIVHPAGMKLFGSFLAALGYGITQEITPKVTSLEISTLGHYTPYSFNTTENLRHNSAGADLYPFGYNGNSGASASDESGTTPHQSAVARSIIRYGETFYNEQSRTGPSGQSVSSGATFNFVVGSCAATWDPGTTGPLWYFSQGVTTDTGGTALANYFSVTADAGDFDNFGSYWVIFPHPNARGITGITGGLKFSEVKIDPFLYIERQVVKSVTSGIEVPFSLASEIVPSETHSTAK